MSGKIAKIDLFKELRKTEYSQPRRPTLVEVKKGIYLAIEGQGSPDGDEFAARVGALYAVAYTVKMTRKFDATPDEQQDYVIGKLEGLWWSDQGPDLKTIPREQWRWKLLIRTPDIVKASELKSATKVLLGKGKTAEVALVKRESLAEGRCVQMLHLGPYEGEWETIKAMLAFAESEGYRSHGRHHEIYISDPRRVPPERLKTILRMPVRR